MSAENSFEKNIEQLEKIIAELEGGDAPLNKCIEMFERGVKLSDECLKLLNDAQQKITLLSENGEREFNPDEDSINE